MAAGWSPVGWNGLTRRKAPEPVGTIGPRLGIPMARFPWGRSPGGAPLAPRFRAMFDIVLPEGVALQKLLSHLYFASPDPSIRGPTVLADARPRPWPSTTRHIPLNRPSRPQTGRSPSRARPATSPRLRLAGG